MNKFVFNEIAERSAISLIFNRSYMKAQFICYLVMLFFIAAFSSCETYEESSNLDNNGNSTLTILTRSGNDGGGADEIAKVSYPINVYVFNEDDECVAVSNVATEEETLSFKLEEGAYDIYAIAGADDETYNLPTKENAIKDTIISLKDGQEHNDLMTANEKITMARDEDCTLTLMLKRKVMLLESVRISDVPLDVTTVMVTISPLYENIMLNGEYSGNKGSYTVDLAKEEDGTTWSAECNKFLLEAAGPVSIKVSLVNNQINSFTYTSDENLKANHKVSIEGTYVEPEMLLKGEITGDVWEEPKDISLEFGGGSNNNDDKGEDEIGDDDIIDSDIPQVGDIYKEDCIVLKREFQGNNVILTLMTTRFKDRLEFEENNQQSIRSAVNAGIAELSVDGINSWRLPTLEELQYVNTNKDFIDRKLLENSKPVFVTGQYAYYFNNDAGEIQAYFPGSGNISSPKSGSGTYNLRAFTTITLSLN